jgi:hypothetical protein
MVVPVRALGVRHLTNDEIARGDLVAHVLEAFLALVLLSFARRLGHRLLIVAERGACSPGVHLSTQMPRQVKRENSHDRDSCDYVERSLSKNER